MVYTQVAIVDENDAAVPGATVYVDTTLPDRSMVSDAGTMGADGTVTFSVRSRQTGTYTSIVTRVSKEGWGYDETANAETSETLMVP